MAGRAAALLVAVLGAGAAGLSLEPVVWHTGNRRFLADGGYVLYPQIGDRLDLVCPGGAGGAQYEYYKLYLVGGAQARRCQVPPAPTLLLTCDRPQRDVRFTIKFQEFSPNLWGHEFRRQHDYYIITTSDGTPEGLENRQGGACLTRAMRVTLRVGQRPGAEPLPDQDGTGSANQTSPPGPGPPPSRGGAVLGGAGGGAALLALVGAGGALWWRRRPRRPPKTPRGGGGAGARPRPHGPAHPLRELPLPPTAPPPAYYKV
ncbi:ephrin-B3 isoform X1 [Oenanthe melanoleuca]|uniref:ephrin-B3 isoform X1 n=1 Tax=Oenanthe melanoleuca TaxID=2939378 RepID=UPI0024C1C5B3|nr:ephrin-B3 isoform X1 [Oenanthe melanoleuca]